MRSPTSEDEPYSCASTGKAIVNASPATTVGVEIHLGDEKPPIRIDCLDVRHMRGVTLCRNCLLRVVVPAMRAALDEVARLRQALILARAFLPATDALPPIDTEIGRAVRAVDAALTNKDA